MRGCAKNLPYRPCSTSVPLYMDCDPIGDLGNDTEVVCDQKQGEVELRAQLAQQVQYPGPGWSHRAPLSVRPRSPGGMARERNGDHDPLSHAAGELVRVVSDASLCVGDVHRIEDARRRVGAPRSGRGPSGLPRSGRRRASRDRARSSAPGNERDAGAANPAHVAFGQREEVTSFEHDTACGHAPGGWSSRRIANAVTDLPLPDSPTRPSVSPGAI